MSARPAPDDAAGESVDKAAGESVDKAAGESVDKAAGEVRPAGRPRAAWLALVAATLIATPAVLLARAFVTTYWERVTTHSPDVAPFARYRSIRAALPDLVRTPDSALEIGVCYTEKGFMPKPFDQRMRDAHDRSLVTFNLATASMHSETMLALSQTLAAAYRDAGTRPRLALIELSPSMVSDESSEEMAGVKRGYNRSLRKLLIRDPGALWAEARRSPTSAAEILSDWILGGPTDIMTSEFLCMSGLNRAPHCQALAPTWWPWPGRHPYTSLGREKYRRWQPLADALRAANGDRALSWSFAERGYIRRMPPSMRAPYQRFAATWRHELTPAFIDDYNRYDRDAIRMFSLEGATFAAYLSGLRTLQSVGTDVIVFISPKANYLTAGPADAALLQGFFDAAAQKIHALGIPVVQMNSQRYSLAEFQNTWGLLSEEEGAPRFSRALADAVAAVLAGRAPDPEIARVLPRAPDGDSSGALAYWKPHRPGAD